MGFNLLLAELLAHVYSYLPFWTIVNFSRINHHWYSVPRQSVLEKKFKDEFNNTLNPLLGCKLLWRQVPICIDKDCKCNYALPPFLIKQQQESKSFKIPQLLIRSQITFSILHVTINDMFSYLGAIWLMDIESLQFSFIIPSTYIGDITYHSRYGGELEQIRSGLGSGFMPKLKQVHLYHISNWINLKISDHYTFMDIFETFPFLKRLIIRNSLPSINFYLLLTKYPKFFSQLETLSVERKISLTEMKQEIYNGRYLNGINKDIKHDNNNKNNTNQLNNLFIFDSQPIKWKLFSELKELKLICIILNNKSLFNHTVNLKSLYLENCTWIYSSSLTFSSVLFPSLEYLSLKNVSYINKDNEKDDGIDKLISFVFSLQNVKEITLLNVLSKFWNYVHSQKCNWNLIHEQNLTLNIDMCALQSIFEIYNSSLSSSSSSLLISPYKRVNILGIEIDSLEDLDVIIKITESRENVKESNFKLIFPNVNVEKGIKVTSKPSRS